MPDSSSGACVPSPILSTSSRWRHEQDLNAEVDTVFMMTSKDYFFVSSGTIKEVASFGGSIAQCVPEVVEEALKKKLGHS